MAVHEPPLHKSRLFAGATIPNGSRKRKRAKLWAEAFEAWLERQEQRLGPEPALMGRQVWQELVRAPLGREGGLNFPWELEAKDIEAYAAWMRSERRSKSAIIFAQATLKDFYAWVGENRIDPASAADFNPAAAAALPVFDLDEDVDDALALNTLLQQGLADGQPLLVEQIEGLRRIGERLLTLQQQVTRAAELNRLTSTYTLTALRVGHLIEARRKLDERAKAGLQSEWAEEVLGVLDRLAMQEGETPPGDEVREYVNEGGWAREQVESGYLARKGSTAAEGLQAEISATQAVLRRILRLAGHAQIRRDVDDLARQAETYSEGCNRLVQLLRYGRPGSGAVDEYLEEQIAKAKAALLAELPIAKRPRRRRK